MQHLKKYPRNNHSGFSLIETVVVMAILSVGLLAMVGGFGIGFQLLQSGNKKTIAAQVAKDTLALLRDSDALFLSHGDPITPDGMPEGMGVIWAAEPTFVAGILMLTVTVTWKETQEHQVSLKTLRFVTGA